MNKIKKDLSIIFVIYKQKKELIQNLLNSISNLQNVKNNIELYFIFDDPFTNYDILTRRILNKLNFKYKIIKTKININKTQQIFNIIPKLNSRYTKIIDGDDKVICTNWVNNIKLFQKNNADILITSYLRLNDNSMKKKKIFVSGKKINGRYSTLNFEPRIAYKTSSLKIITSSLIKNYDFKNHSYMDDQIRIWNILQLKNSKYKRTKILTTEYNTTSGRTKDNTRNIDEILKSMYKVFLVLNTNEIHGYWFRHNLGLYLFPKFVILNKKQKSFSDKIILDLKSKISIITKFSIKKINKKIEKDQNKWL